MQFVQQNPTAPLAPNAYYWMGESYMNLKAYEKAIVQFQEVIDRFPKSDKAAKAMLRQAEGFAAIGDKKSSTTDSEEGHRAFSKNRGSPACGQGATEWHLPVAAASSCAGSSVLSRATIS